MKEKKNIIKKISHSNSYLFLFKREIKRCFKKKQYKLKKYNIILKNVKYFKSTVNMLNFFKKLQIKIKFSSLIKKNTYLNYITDGLNLKYDELLLQIFEKKQCINNFQIINVTLSKNDLNIIKLHKIYTIFDKNFHIYKNETVANNDYFFAVNFLYFNQILEIYKNLNYHLILKIN